MRLPAGRPLAINPLATARTCQSTSLHVTTLIGHDSSVPGPGFGRRADKIGKVGHHAPSLVYGPLG